MDLKFDLFSNAECVVDLDAEVPDGALQLRVPKQQLYARKLPVFR
jgi:hypothetical protein